MHQMTGVTGTVKASGGTIVGFVSADITVETATGKYNQLGSKYSASHSRGLVSITGTIRKAWGVTSGALWSWYTNDQELDIVFDGKGDDTLKLTASSCCLTGISIEGMEAGSENALILTAPFEGLTYANLDPT